MELSEDFVMVNLGDDEEPSDPKYKPDGGYIPRILFFHPDGSFLPEITNTDGNPKYKYYHYDPQSVLESMDQVNILQEKLSIIFVFLQVIELSETWEDKVKDEL